MSIVTDGPSETRSTSDMPEIIAAILTGPGLRHESSAPHPTATV